MSIVIPTYNSVDTLDDALTSVFGQTYPDIEVVIVDDGSTDTTTEYLASHEQRDGLHLISQDNAGAAAARNTGLDVAEGEFVLFVDSDVVLFPTLVERMVLTLRQNPEAAYAYCDFTTLQLFGSWRPELHRAGAFDAARLRQSNYIACVSLVRKELCPRWDPRIRALQDWDVWLTLLDRGHAGVYIPEALFETVDREASITQAWSRNHYVRALAEVRAKHVSIMLVVVTSGTEDDGDTLVRQLDGSHMTRVETVFVAAGSTTQTMKDAVRTAIGGALEKHEYVVVLDELPGDLRPDWLYELMKISEFSFRQLVMSFGSSSVQGETFVADGVVESRLLGHRLSFGGPAGSSFAVPTPLLRTLRGALAGTESLTSQVLRHAESSGHVTCTVDDLHDAE